MISICIPIYNFNVTELVSKLSAQVKTLGVPAEIILIDDCSKKNYKELNESICSKEQYIKLDKNIGRSAIRNRFIEYAKYDYLLFLDCDSLVIGDLFLNNYLEAIHTNPEAVICGGRVYDKKTPAKDKMLRWKYGIVKESKPAEERSQKPHSSFMSNNFLISKSLFQKIKFDERIVGYGHEDTLLGFELKKQNVSILHINNPILNGDIENNETYLKNTESAVINLIQILKHTNHNKELINEVTLLRIFYNVFFLRKTISFIFMLVAPLIKSILIAGYANLYLFDFYKLGILCKNYAKQ